MSEIISDTAALAQCCERLGALPALGLDTEFLRERTYFPQLCLLQLGFQDGALCIDTLHIGELGALRALFGAARIVKVLHAARQDIEVLWPATGAIAGLFDTQVAAALIGMPTQIGYAELVRELLGVQLPKAETRTDWSARPLSAAQVRYALDDVKYLLALRERLAARLSELGRLGWFEEEMAAIEAGGSFAVDPEQAWRRLKGIAQLDAPRLRLARELAAWRERRAVALNRPRNWILPDVALREIVLKVPRSTPQLASIAELPEGIRRRSGTALLELLHASGLPAKLPPPPAPGRPSPAHLERIGRLALLTRQTGRELGLAPEMLATRREMERLAAGAREGGPLEGWRREVIGERLLAAL